MATKKPKKPTEWVVYQDGEPHRVFQTEDEAVAYKGKREAPGGDLPKLEVKGQ